MKTVNLYSIAKEQVFKGNKLVTEVKWSLYMKEMLLLFFFPPQLFNIPASLHDVCRRSSQPLNQACWAMNPTPREAGTRDAGLTACITSLGDAPIIIIDIYTSSINYSALSAFLSKLPCCKLFDLNI